MYVLLCVGTRFGHWISCRRYEDDITVSGDCVYNLRRRVNVSVDGFPCKRGHTRRGRTRKSIRARRFLQCSYRRAHSANCLRRRPERSEKPSEENRTDSWTCNNTRVCVTTLKYNTFMGGEKDRHAVRSNRSRQSHTRQSATETVGRRANGSYERFTRSCRTHDFPGTCTRSRGARR